MRIVQVSHATPAVVTVPDDCVAVLSFHVVGLTGDIIGVDRIFRTPGAVLSTDPNATWNNATAGNATGILAIANREIQKIPVSAGERLLVSFEDTSSAVICFETAEN